MWDIFSKSCTVDMIYRSIATSTLQWNASLINLRWSV